MKFKSLEAQGFGRLADWISPEIEKDMVVVYGSNEAGKTTLFKLVSTILYGWSPASRDNNPYVPWGSAMAQCGARLIDGEGNEIYVDRRLKAKADGTLILGGKNIRLGNNCLDQLRFLSPQIFSEVYALTIEQMNFPQDQVWVKLQDGLLGGQFGSFLNTVHEAAAKLEVKANSLWRPDRIGKPLERQLKEKAAALVADLRKAEDNEKALHKLEEDLAQLNEEAERLLEVKSMLIAGLDRYQRLFPVHQKLTKIQELTKEAGDILSFSFMPAEPLESIAEIEKNIENLEGEQKKLYLLKDMALKKCKSFTPLDEAVYESRERIMSVRRSYSQVEGDIQGSLDMEFEISRIKDRLYQRAKDVLTGGWKPEAAESLNRIDEADIRACIERFKRANAEYLLHEARVEGLKAREGGKNPVKLIGLLSILLILSGIAGILFGGNLFFRGFFGAVAALGITIFVVYKFSRRSSSGSSDLKEAKKSLAKSSQEKANAALKVEEALKGLKISQARIESPDESLMMDINTLKDLLFKLGNAVERKEAIEKRIQKVKGDTGEIMKDLNLAGRGDILRDISFVESLLTGAEARFHDAWEGKSRLDEIEGQLKELDRRLWDAQNSRRNLHEGLEKIEGYTLQEKAETFKYRRRCLERAQNLKEEMENEYADLPGIIGEIQKAEEEGENWLFNPEQEARHKVEREQLDIRLNELNEKIGSHKTELQQRQERERMDDLRGQLNHIEDERRKNASARDRLMLLRNMLLEADRRFKEENQPDVLMRAGDYLKLITDGRYYKLYAKEGEESGLMVRGDYEGYPLDVNKPLSRGSLEQIYLSLRLALIDHLDNGHERLPLFLDEALVNWDEARTHRGLKLLREVSKNRQVFLFTCHRWLVDSLSDQEDVQILELV